MRPLSFTRNLGGLRRVHDSIRAGYKAGISVKDFREKCGLSTSLSLLITEFFLGTQIYDREEIILADSLIAQTLNQPYSRMLARLYFFALNLNMPGQRLRDEHRNPAEMQNALIRDHLFEGAGLRVASFNKDEVIEPVIRSFGGFTSQDALRKWVNNYSFMAEQCDFVPTPSGLFETFPDTWAALALRLFFERFRAISPASDVLELVSAGQARELHKLIGVPKAWLDARIAGAADMFLSDEDFIFAGFEEEKAERKAAERGTTPPIGGETVRRKTMFDQIIRRSKNHQFLWDVYAGECQISGVRLNMPDGSFSVDCAHIRPLGRPYCGEDDVSNMLSLSPTMHRLFDRGCVRIDPDSFAISLLHGNRLPVLPRLLIRGSHVIQKGNLSYHLSEIIKGRTFP